MTVLAWEWPPWKSFVESRDNALKRFDDAVEEVKARARVKEINQSRESALAALEQRRETQRPPPE